MGNSSGRIVPILDLGFELQSGVNFGWKKLMRPKPRIHKSHLPCFGASWWLIVFFAGSFRRTKIHMETQKIMGFKITTPLPWGSMLNFRILWVLWFRSRTFFKFLGNNLISDTLTNPSCWEDLDIQKTDSATQGKKQKRQQQNQWVNMWILTHILNLKRNICLHVLVENNVLDFQIFNVSPLRISSSWPPLLPAFQTSQISGRPTVHRHGHPVEHWERRHHYLKCSATSEGKRCDFFPCFPAKKT